MEQIADLLVEYPLLYRAVIFAGVILVASVANFIVKKILLRTVRRLLRQTKFGGRYDVMHHNVVARIANIVPAIIIMAGMRIVPDMPETAIQVIQNVGHAFIILTVILAMAGALDVVNLIYHERRSPTDKPIKGYIQLVKIVLFVICAILVIATLIDKSPLILLSGLGAMTAVLMLVFQDTLLSLVASVQISSSDMVRVGDWIEMPNLNADGDVIDIALHTVKVQNWDKTITTLPTRRLISDPFKNWRGMQESGGRRIKRALYIDQSSIRFLRDDEKESLKQFSLLHDYLQRKEEELAAWNKRLGAQGGMVVNTRRLTNIGTFRAYVKRYLEDHPSIRSDMTQIVRQLSPGPTGLPIEIYCFTNTVVWAEYEAIQSDIFDYLYAILPEFGLRAYQQPSGDDLKDALKGVKGTTVA